MWLEFTRIGHNMITRKMFQYTKRRLVYAKFNQNIIHLRQNFNVGDEDTVVGM